MEVRFQTPLFVVMSLMSIILGIAPLVYIPAGIMGMLTLMLDCMDVHLIFKRTHKGAVIQSQNMDYNGIVNKELSPTSYLGI